MSAGVDAAKGAGVNSRSQWPNILLLHLHLKTSAAPPSHSRQYYSSRASANSSTRLSASSAAEIRQAPYSRAANASQHALNAFTAAFKDAFKRRQAARCLSLVFDYASSLPQATDETRLPSSYVSPIQAPLPPAPQPPQLVVSEPSRQQGDHAAGRGSSTMTGQSRLLLSVRSKRHLSQVLKGRHQELMKMLIADGNAHGAIDYLYLLPPDRQLCSCLMKECSAAGNYAGLQMAIKARRSLGMEDDAFSYCSLVTTAGRMGSSGRLKKALQSAQSAGACNVVVCNAAIEGFGRVEDAQAALDVFENQMPELGLQPDIITYNSLLRILGRSQDATFSTRVMRLYKELCHSTHVAPDKHTFSAVFSAAMQLRITDGGFLFQVLSDTSMYGVPINSRIMFTFLQACWGATFTREQVARVFAEVAAMRAHRQPDQSVFAALLTFAQRHLPEHAVGVWAALQEDNLMPNEHIYSALFAACAEGRTPDLLATANAAEDRMHQQWLSLKTSTVPSYQNEKGWGIAYNSLLNLHAKTGQAEQAENVYQGMLLHGPSPNRNSINSTIAAFAAVGDTDAAFQRYREMCLRDLRPDVSTFGSLLHACAQVGNDVSAARVMELLRSAGFAPSVQAYTSLIDACVKANTATSLSRAFQVFKQMQAEGVQATEVTYGCLLVACERVSDVDRAFLLYKEACDQGIPPSDACHNILINVCAATGRLHEALDLVKEMARSHRSMQAATLNSLVRALGPSSAARALRMVSFMTTLGLPTYHMTSIALIGACARQHMSAEALDLYWRLRKQGVLVTRSAGSDLIVALCKAEQPGKALRVYHDMMASAFGAPGSLLPSSSQGTQRGQSSSWSTTSGSRAANDNSSACSDSADRSQDSSQALHVVIEDPHTDSDDGGASLAAEAVEAVNAASMGITPQLPAQPLELVRPKPARADSVRNAGSDIVLHRGLSSSPSIQSSTPQRVPQEAWKGAPSRSSTHTDSTPQQHDRAAWSKPAVAAGDHKKQPTVIPHVAALGALVGALARASELDQALQLYKQVGRDPAGAQALTMSDRFMWQSLMEVCCRKGRIAMALQVFDDWKTHVSHALEQGTEAGQLPRLSNVTLAFLEACCRADLAFEWRVFDVCAAMRQQSERKQQAQLARPRKLSHHFYEEG